jgi:hypothetical protein
MAETMSHSQYDIPAKCKKCGRCQRVNVDGLASSQAVGFIELAMCEYCDPCAIYDRQQQQSVILCKCGHEKFTHIGLIPEGHCCHGGTCRCQYFIPSVEDASLKVSDLEDSQELVPK